MGGRLWVLGDSWSDPWGYPWSPEFGWPQLLAARLDVGIINSALSGGGYLAGAANNPFGVQAAHGAGAGADVVIAFGSLNDPNSGQPADAVGRRASVVFGLIGRLCPDAALIVVGPQWGAHERTAELLATVEAVAAAADTAGAPFVDPSGWFLGATKLLIDPWHPNQAGHATIADRLEHDVALALLTGPTVNA